jgi:choline dehydrogenase-like flavoprotein
MSSRVDAIVVGLGAAGGLVATDLARAGMKVVGLEKGRFYKQADFKTSLTRFVTIVEAPLCRGWRRIQSPGGPVKGQRR